MVDKPQLDNEYENIKENINKCQQMSSNRFADDACRGTSVSTRALFPVAPAESAPVEMTDLAADICVCVCVCVCACVHAVSTVRPRSDIAFVRKLAGRRRPVCPTRRFTSSIVAYSREATFPSPDCAVLRRPGKVRFHCR